MASRDRIREQRSPTLHELAAMAGVHVSTVSRVLRQTEPPDGWTETALRVRRLADELGYRPNLMAASLRTRRTLTIGVVMSRLTDFVMASMYEAIESAAAAAGYQILLSSPPDIIDAQQKSVNLLLNRQVDGILLASVHRPAQHFVDAVAARGIPLLLMNRHGDCHGPMSITCDDHHGGYLAMQHLLQLGHRRIGVVAGPLHASTANDRVSGVRQAARDFGLTVHEELIIHSDFELDGGISAGRRLLEMPDRPTAIFAISDTAAIGVMGVARDMGLRLPRDLSVVGYNDVPIASQLPVALTTIRSPFAEMGKLALLRMLDLIEDREIETTLLPVSLVPRASTSKPTRK